VIPTGNVSGTWSLAKSPYHIEGEITIPNDSTLTIEPGVDVIFFGHYALNVQGRLLAIGTEVDTTVFTVNDTLEFHNADTSLGGWNGIQFIDTPLNNDTSKIIHCKLSYGKAVGSSPPDNAGGAIHISNFHKVLISNCLIINNSAGGLNSPSGGALYLFFSNIKLKENVISKNQAWDGGAILIYECDAVFINNWIVSNHADEGGGGIWMGGLSNPEFKGDIISNNISENNGGGMICWQSTHPTLDSVSLTGNSANWGGGIGLIDCILEMNNCNVTDNYAAALGGGISSDFSTLNLNNIIFERDTSGSQSGAIHSWHSNLNINDCQFRDNKAVIGGGIHAEFSQLDINNSSFFRNSANNGAGIHANSIHLLIDSSNFSQNVADNEGAAIQYTADTVEFSTPYQVELTHSRFDLNYATNLVGGVNINQHNSDSSLVNLLVDNCTFTANSADHVSAFRILGDIHNFTISNSFFSGNYALRWAAGANFISRCKGDVINCLFNSNQAAIGGNNATSGGAGVTQEAVVDFYNCTFVNNAAGSGAGLHVRFGGIATVINSIFWGNSPSSISLVSRDSISSTLTINNCDIQDGIDSVAVDSLSSLHWGQKNINSDPLFVNPAGADYHLHQNSPCIGTGIDSLEISGLWYVAPITDLEGNPRPNPAGSLPDMGVYESPLGTPTAIADIGVNIPLRFSLEQNYPNPFNPTTFISWQLAVGSPVTIKLFNIRGQEVAVLLNEIQAAGSHQLILDGQHLASGIYFYQLQAGPYTAAKKMILLR
jgi:hypothetical protein